MSIPFSVDSLGKSIPIWLCDLNSSLWNILEGGNFITEYLPGENKLVVHTDRLGDEPLETVKTTAESYMPDGATLEQYNHHIEVSWRDINKYANFRNNTELMAFASLETIQNDLTSDGEWCYPMTMFSYKFVYSQYWDGLKNHSDIFYKNKARKITLIAQNASLSEHAMDESPNLEEVYVESKYEQIPYVFMNCKKLKKVVVKGGAANWIGSICRNCTSLEEVDITMADNGQNFNMAFYGCKLNKASALRMLGQMTKKMTWWFHNDKTAHYGIHVDHQNDPEVLAAIAAAEENEWELTVQWNGTPTSTASMMRFGQLIYAKVVENERPDGTTDRYLDWGHYVTNREEYETFRSLESAYKYFNLEMPENE